MKSSRDEKIQLTQPKSKGSDTVFEVDGWETGNRAAAESREELREYLKKWLRKHLSFNSLFISELRRFHHF